MDVSTARKYIPVGCLLVQERLGAASATELQASVNLHQWKAFAMLPPNLQEYLLLCPSLRLCKKLLAERWIHLEFKLCTEAEAPCSGVVRVYLLPDDVGRRAIDRSNTALKKDRQALLFRLDFSPDVWLGDLGGQHDGLPTPPPWEAGNSRDDQEQVVSLLQMFNSIPSPDPRPDLIQDANLREAMQNLLDSTIPGLKSTLYAHQRRSAALMLQRESYPGQLLDPRLIRVNDQHGEPWYYDSSTGVCLRESRHYDGVSGGILAEEMGAGKTLICLALILATRHHPAQTPDIFHGNNMITRHKIGSLVDMAASAVTRNSFPWGLYFNAYEAQGLKYDRCIDAIRRNPGWYWLPRPEARRKTRQPLEHQPPTKIYLSQASLVIVPTNLVQQWRQEIARHTSGLRVLILTTKKVIPAARELANHDIVLFSLSRFEQLRYDRVPDRNGTWMLESPIARVHFKRVIVDEGHKLGNAKIGKKSNILLVLECLQVSARWIVTGTPSTGLFGVEDSVPGTPVRESAASDDDVSNALGENEKPSSSPSSPSVKSPHGSGKRLAGSSGKQEREDLGKIGSMARFYLKVRPWANALTEDGDTPAEWEVYIMQPKHSPGSYGRKDCLRATLNSLIIRHRLSEVSDQLPTVDEKFVYLDGSYQDRLCLNLFSMMIIFNSVQSQRTDQDYFFHHRQQRSLLELVSNLRQSSFFGGSFFSAAEIYKSVKTAEKFLQEKKVAISDEDGKLLRDAISFGRVALNNHLKDVANRFHEIPFYVRGFPGGPEMRAAWSLDSREEDPVCTDWRMIQTLQAAVLPVYDAPESLTFMMEGRLVEAGKAERTRWADEVANPPHASQGAGHHAAVANRTLAGNTRLGEDKAPRHLRSESLNKAKSEEVPTLGPDAEVCEPLAGAQIISTASAKLSYLIDAIIQYQEEEQILIFYENDNVAWYLGSVLEILQVRHLIYAKGISAERRAQYVATFRQNRKIRVLLMDITQAAFGLDMQSASRIYFVNPVLNPQVEAQAIGRARRIGQEARCVTVETLVLRGSLEEVIVSRRAEMTQAEHRRCKNILDDRPIYDWILNARVGGFAPLPGQEQGLDEEPDGPGQMAPLRTPQFVFGRGRGRVLHPDEDLVMSDAGGQGEEQGQDYALQRFEPSFAATGSMSALQAGVKRARDDDVDDDGRVRSNDEELAPQSNNQGPRDERGINRSDDVPLPQRPARRVRFATDSNED